MIVEVCANSLQSALNAEAAGADRLEICIELGLGGITPSYGLLKELKKRIRIPMHVLIRPRSGDFTYSDSEFDAMLKDIALCRDLGFEGVVSGVLKPDYGLDHNRTEQLVKMSGEMQFTFHRAFDWLEEPYNALKDLETLGLDNVLTSGQAATAVEGLDMLQGLMRHAGGICIIPAAGIRPQNVLLFKEAGFSTVHLSGTRNIQTLQRPPKVQMNSQNLINEDCISVTDRLLIEDLIKIVK